MTVTTEPLVSYLFQVKIDKAGPLVVGGKGTHIDVEIDGKVKKSVIDGATSAAVGSLSWGDEDVHGIINKAPSSTYSYPTLISNKNAEDLAKFYIDNSPEGFFASALWCTSGSESNKNALRIIRQYWVERGLPEKVKLFSRKNSSHGFTLAAQSISSNSRAEPFSPYLLNQKNTCLKMPCAYIYCNKKADETEEQYAQRLLDILEKKILDNDPSTVPTETTTSQPVKKR